MKFLKTVKTFGNVYIVVPFSSEEVETSFRIVKTSITTVIESEFKPEDIVEKDFFGNIISCTTYLYTKEKEAYGNDDIPF